MRILGFTLALLVALAWSPALRGQQTGEGTWKQVDDDDGIKIWRLELPGQDLPGFRGEAVIAAPAEAIVKVLKRVDEHTQWMHRCSASETLKQLDAEHVVIYNRTDTPWPVWDRDAVLDTQFRYGPDPRSIVLTFVNAEPGLRAPPPNVVRMPRLAGSYRMWKLAPDKTKVVYQVEVDIGGSVPRWIAERVARDMPYETLSRLRARVTGAAP